MKIGVIAGIAFVVGLVGSTFAMKKSPAAPAAAEGDSSHVVGDSTHAPKDPAAVPAESSAAVPDTTHKADSAAAPVATHTEKPSVTPATTPPAGAATGTPDFQRLAGILAKLAPAEAAPLLEHFTDAEVEGVLRRMDVTRVASLLAALPKERSAVLGKRLLLSGAGPSK